MVIDDEDSVFDHRPPVRVSVDHTEARNSDTGFRDRIADSANTQEHAPTNLAISLTWRVLNFRQFFRMLIISSGIGRGMLLIPEARF
jgi:hypothetical protein